jgi:hypothetical protein
MHGVVVPFIARRLGDEIVLEVREAKDDTLMRWIFSEVTPERFLWRNAVSADGEGTWTTQQDFVCRRVA